MTAVPPELPVVEPESALWPPAGGSPAVVLGLGSTGVERRLIDDFARRLRSREDVDVPLTYDVGEAVATAARDDATIAPVGVAWLPPERGGSRRFGVRDLLATSNVSPGRARLQERILARAPDRCRVVVGEPARRSELLARWERHSDRPAGDGRAAGEGRPEGAGSIDATFGVFVERQARLAVDRAERAVLGSRYKTAQHVVDDLTASGRFRADLDGLAAELGRDGEHVAAEARGYLEELATVQSRFARDVWAQWSHFLWGRAYELQVDTAGLERLRELNGRYPIVFLPSHKANLDGFVMASVMYERGFPGTHVLGGINMAFWPLGALGRRVGVIWIRRSFGGNEVYKFALRRYLAYLASKRLNLEWYIEGGRSRTGKLLPPRMGLLNYLARGVEEAGVEEVLLAPVSIVYDRLNEVVEMTAEARGATKRPEGFGWLVRYAGSQKGRLGRIQVNFGEPLALRAALDAAPTDDDAARELALSKAAFEVCTRINRATPVTTISLATLALLGADGWAMTTTQARTAIDPLRRYVRQRELPGSDALAELESDDGTRGVLQALVEHGVVERFDGGSEPVYRIGPDRELAAAFYRNVVIHWFVNRAIMELALVAATESGEGQDPMLAALDEAFALRDLLKFEFFFAEKEQFRDEQRAEVALVDPAWREKGGAGLQVLGGALAASGGLMADRILRSFLEAYWVVSDRLAARGDGPVEHDELVAECLGVGQQYHLQRRIVSGEAVSAELFKTGLRLAANRGLLEPGDGVADGRARLARELHEGLRRLEILAGWDRAQRLRREGATP